MRKGCWASAVALLLLAAGCGSSSSGNPDGTGDTPGDHGEAGDVPDGGGDADADADAEDVTDGADADADADADATAKHTVISLTAGGGRATSSGYQLTLSIGAPQPMGSAESGTHRTQVGPGTAVNQ